MVHHTMCYYGATIKNEVWAAGKMALWLRMYTATPDDLRSIPRTHIESSQVRSSQVAVTPVPGALTPHAQTYTYTHVKVNL